MIVCVESNFVLELAFLQEEYQSAEEILKLAEAGRISLVLPAFSIGEPYERMTRRARDRRALHKQLLDELSEMARSKPFERIREEYRDVTGLLISSAEEEKQRLDDVLRRILATADIIPLAREVFLAATEYQKSLSLGPQSGQPRVQIVEPL